MPTSVETPSAVNQEHVARFEQKVKAAKAAVAGLPDDDFYNQLWNIIHRQGWTTIAEGMFFESAVDSIAAQAQALTQLHQQVLAAADAVGR